MQATMSKKELKAWAIERFLSSFKNRYVERLIEAALQFSGYDIDRAIDITDGKSSVWLGGGYYGSNGDCWEHRGGKRGILTGWSGSTQVEIPVKQIFMIVRDRMKIPGTLF